MACYKESEFIYIIIVCLFLVSAFQIVNICVDILLGKKDKVKEMIKYKKIYETPIYDLDFNTFKPSNDKIYFESFYEFKGRKEKIEKDNETSTRIYDNTNISKIYQHYFIYKKDERTYFDYLTDFTVKAGENCKEKYKQCGIFNSQERILCLPNEEECPLNGFGISSEPSDPNYDNNYKKFEVSDIITNKKYYFFYTNKNINEKIITTFKLSHGFPCYSFWQESWISVFPDEYEEECYNNERDFSYIKIPGDLSLKSLYIDNNINITDAGSSIDSIVNLYANNYNYIIENEECITDYFSNYEEEKNYINAISIIIRIINIISLLLTLFLLFYLGLILFCCCINVKFYWAFFIFQVYGIIEHIVSLSLIKVHKYEFNDTCDNREAFNSIKKEISGEYEYNDGGIICIMSIMSISLLIISSFLSLCIIIKHRKNGNYDKNNDMINGNKSPSGIQTPIPAGAEIPNSVNIQQTPINKNNNNNEYVIPYYSIPQNNNQSNYAQPDNFGQSQIHKNLNNNAPSSELPLEKKTKKKKKKKIVEK